MPTVILSESGDLGEFIASTPQHSIKVGGGEMSAGELLLIALGACAAGRAKSYLRERGISESQLRVELSSIRPETVSPYQTIEVQFYLDRQPTQEEENALRDIFAAGRIHTTLTQGPKIEYRLKIHNQ